jgi:hypothetical protein
MVLIASAVPNVLTTRFLLETDARRRQLSRDVMSGRRTRVVRGVYIDSDLWDHAPHWQRYVLFVRAVTMMQSSRGVVSHASAAAMLGWPRVTRYPAKVHLTDPGRETPRTNATVRWHATDVDDTETIAIDGVAVTSPLRTLRDVLRTASRVDAVAVADFALRRGIVQRLDAVRTLELVPGTRGSRRAREAIAFADPDAESAGESFSRVVVDELGFAPPETQVEFAVGDGRIARVDFWWPDPGVIGEFDGRIKYTRSGEDGAENLYREKRREDELRHEYGVTEFLRWGWRELERPSELAEMLLRAGVPRRRAARAA